MSHDPVAPGDGADDLLGRWLAHHDNTVVDDDASAGRPAQVPIRARPSEAAAQRLTRPSAATALAELRAEPPVDEQRGPGGVTPPSTFGVRRGLPGSADSGPTGALGRRIATSEVAELDRPSPVGFEPVILRSVRKKTEPKEEPEKKDRGGRLSRLRSRVAGPVEEAAPPEESPAVALRAEPVAVVPPPVFKAPASPPRKHVPIEDVIALATTPSLSVAAPHPQPEPQPEPQPAPQPEVQPEVEPVLPEPDTEPTPVVPEPEPQPEVDPVLPGPDTEPTPVVPDPEPLPEPQPEIQAQTVAEVEVEAEAVLPEPDLPAPADEKVPAKRRLVRARRPEPDPEPEERKRRPLVARSANPPTTGTGSGTGTGSAARGLLAAARTAAPAPTLASQARPAPKQVEPVPMLPVEPEVEAPAPAAPSMQMPTVYEFEPRRSARRFLSLMLIVGLVASGRLGYAAYLSRDTIEIGIAGIVTVATLVIWAIRAGATVTRLTVKSGQLEIARQGGRMVFDLASSYTAIEVVGRPGSKKWKVLFLRRGLAPVTVDSTMVDGREFMRVLGFFRPEVARAR
jgi:hypothetical protein